MFAGARRNMVFALAWQPVPAELYFPPAALKVALESPRKSPSCYLAAHGLLRPMISREPQKAVFG
jgi:hypothetical protein